MLADPGSNGRAVGRSLNATGSDAPSRSIWRGVSQHRQPRRDGAAIQSFFALGCSAGLAETADLSARDDATNHAAEVGGEPVYYETVFLQDPGDHPGLAQTELGGEQPPRPQQPTQVGGDRAVG
jgi:hypothetical protein